jgi:dinuclear metal center YbgI/SA1388 family protein
MPTVADIAKVLEEWLPIPLAAEWDNVGLLLGERQAQVLKIMTCLTVTPESVAEAIDAGANLIVSHHPIMFRAVKRLTDETPEGRMVLALARAGVSVYSPHTAFDNAPDGINDLLARKLRLQQVMPLRSTSAARQFKVAVFVPDSDLEKVADAMFAAGAGRIGEYSQCSFRLRGTGTFFGSESARPAVGQKGIREHVQEWRLEAICPEQDLEQVVMAMRRAHSYEEPAYDVYQLRPSGTGLGAGRVGLLPGPVPLSEFARSVKSALAAHAIQIVGDGERSIQRVAIACGAAGEFLADAVSAGADVFLTGEMRFHDCLEARAREIALLLPGHYATERCGVEHLARRLQERWPDLSIWASRREQDPLRTERLA